MIGADKKYIVFGFLLFFFNFKNAWEVRRYKQIDI
jgi:hypothetical protein